MNHWLTGSSLAHWLLSGTWFLAPVFWPTRFLVLVFWLWISSSGSALFWTRVHSLRLCTFAFVDHLERKKSYFIGVEFFYCCCSEAICESWLCTQFLLPLATVSQLSWINLVALWSNSHCPHCFTLSASSKLLLQFKHKIDAQSSVKLFHTIKFWTLSTKTFELVKTLFPKSWYSETFCGITVQFLSSAFLQQIAQNVPKCCPCSLNCFANFPSSLASNFQNRQFHTCYQMKWTSKVFILSKQKIVSHWNSLNYLLKSEKN